MPVSIASGTTINGETCNQRHNNISRFVRSVGVAVAAGAAIVLAVAAAVWCTMEVGVALEGAAVIGLIAVTGLLLSGLLLVVVMRLLVLLVLLVMEAEEREGIGVGASQRRMSSYRSLIIFVFGNGVGRSGYRRNVTETSW